MSVFNSIANWNPWVYYHARTSKSLVSQECFYQLLTFSILKYLNFTFTECQTKGIHDMSTWGKTKLCLPWRVGSEFYTAASSIAPVHKELWQEDSVSNEILSDAQMCQSLHFANFTRVSHRSRHICSMYGRTFLICLDLKKNLLWS